MKDLFKNDEEVKALVSAFEGCQIHPANFKHYQHLAVALWYVTNFPFDVATKKMCNGIRRLAAAYGKSGYHETITLFWLILVREFFMTRRATSIAGLANLIADEYDKTAIRGYYSEELLASDLAKNGWIEPDLKPLKLYTEV